MTDRVSRGVETQTRASPAIGSASVEGSGTAVTWKLPESRKDGGLMPSPKVTGTGDRIRKSVKTAKNEPVSGPVDDKSRGGTS